MTEKWTAGLLGHALVKRYADQTTTANLFEFKLSAEHDDDGRYERRTDLLSIFSNGVSADHQFVTQRTALEQRGWADKLHRLPSGWRTAFELKVSRSDFLTDVKDKFKHTPMRKCVNEFYFVTPRGLLRLKPMGGRFSAPDAELLPYGAGVIEVFYDPRQRWRTQLRCEIVRAADLNMMPDTTKDFVDAVVRRTLYGQVSSGERAFTYRKHMAVSPFQ